MRKFMIPLVLLVQVSAQDQLPDKPLEGKATYNKYFEEVYTEIISMPHKTDFIKLTYWLIEPPKDGSRHSKRTCIGSEKIPKSKKTDSTYQLSEKIGERMKHTGSKIEVVIDAYDQIGSKLKYLETKSIYT